MKNKTIDYKKIIIENEYEKDFKKYINKISNVFGEDYAAIVLTCNKDIKESLKIFSSKFKSLNSTNIESMLFQSAILSERNNYNDLFNIRTNEDFWFELFLRIDKDMFLKKSFIREFIKDSDKSNISLFNKLKSKEEKEKALYNLYQLKKYEKSLSIQVEHQRRR